MDNPGLPATHVARVIADQATARRLSDVFAESFEEQGVAAAAFEATEGAWTFTAHFPAPPNQAAVRALVALASNARLANKLVFERIEARDWVAESLRDLAPVVAGRFFIHGRHDRARLRGSRVGIEIEAGLAFGTGHHATTRGCLLALDVIVKHACHPNSPLRPRVLDVGTGTGLLAIAAAKALRTQVLASDIDRRAVMVAHENARLNKVGPLLEIVHAAGLDAPRLQSRAPFDLIFANILLGPLQRLARPIRRVLAPGARVVLSGLLNAQAPAALSAYRAQGLVLERRIRLEGWTTLVMWRPP